MVSPYLMHRRKAFRSGGAAWTPADITTALWLNESGTAASWTDNSGNGRTLATGVPSETPTLGTQNSLTTRVFDGSDVVLRGSDTTTQNISQLSLFAVFNTTGGGSTRRTVIRFNTNSTGSRAGLWATSTGVEAGGRRLDGDGFQSVTASGTGWTIGSGLFNYSAAMLQVGVNATYTSRSGGFQTSGSTSNTASTNVLSGSEASGFFTDGFAGSIGEIIVIVGTLTLEDRQRIEGYLAHKWGLTANLPGDHPYKSVAP